MSETINPTAIAETDLADVLKPWTVAANASRAWRMCWLERHPLQPGTAAFVDGEGMVVCAECAEHATSCRDDDCDHPQYVYARTEAEG
jgi:hypothetical protein